MKKIILPFLLLVSIFFTAHGQDFLLAEQWFSRLNRNPAATGNSADINIFGMGRQQWVGFDDSPKTVLLNAHGFFEGISSGLGVIFNYHQEGIADQTINAKLAYSYQTPIAKNMLLSFGVSAGVLNKSFDPDKLTYNNNGVRPDANLDDAKTNFDMDLGIEFSMPVFMAGFAVDHVLAERDDVTNVTTGRQFTGYVRGNIPLCQKLSLAPAVVYNNYENNVPSFFEVNATAFYDKLYWLGVGTRFDDETNFTMLNAIIGFEWRLLRIGYGYEYSLGDLGNFKKSTHEIMLSLRIPKSDAKRTKQRFVRFME